MGESGYGNGPSTGLDQTASGKITAGFKAEDVAISEADRAVLRRVAERDVMFQLSAEESQGSVFQSGRSNLEDQSLKYDAQFRAVFDAIRQLLPPLDTGKRRRVGFRVASDED